MSERPTPELAGILGGLDAYLDFLGVETLEELEDKQLRLDLEENCDERLPAAA